MSDGEAIGQLEDIQYTCVSWRGYTGGQLEDEHVSVGEAIGQLEDKHVSVGEAIQ